MILRLLQTLVGKPLQRHQTEAATLPNFEALAILSSDALSSVAYGTEATLGVLVLAGSGALKLSIPITLAIIGLVAIVVLSYRQTIEAYPQGGGSYVVARENLGTTASLVAAASLLIDYVLTAAVSLMAGTQALSSLLPQLLPHEVSFSLILLVLVGWANLRGVKDAGRLFAYPTYAFVVMVALMTISGVLNLAFGHGFHADPPPPIKALEPLGLFLILRAFSSGCSAMTGIEAISNGVKLFRAPAAANARLTMVVMGAILSLMFFSVSALGYAYGIAPNPNQTVMAQIGGRVFGEGSVLLWALQIATLLILALAANTSFADFPRLAALLAKDKFLPRQMGWVGDRLVFQNGILILLLAAGLVIVICQGDTNMAVNLYALGVFTAFTLSQAGMVRHWWRLKGSAWLQRLLMNAIGALTTFLVLLVIVVSKFNEGAWSVVVAVPLIVLILAGVRRRYREVYGAMALPEGYRANLCLPKRSEPIGNRSIVWVASISEPTLNALRYAAAISDHVLGVWVKSDEEDAAEIEAAWIATFGINPDLELRIIDSPGSSLVAPFVDCVETEEDAYPELLQTIVMPMAIPRKPFDGLLLNQRAVNMRQALIDQRNRIFTVVRYYLSK
ncbi:MAG: APC family permease [Synechococcaceae bacterium WBA_3_309]|nr:APC family permease [Synechococcaceae bacterium WB5_2A_257]NDA75669.1 APC family permease [Synechococcaceae bacterium WB8_3_299]NDD21749.1 APC family permease [Synechococcaceae bacterium WBA_3_309]